MKTVAIVGTSERSRHLAPYHDSSIDIWLFNSNVIDDTWAKRCNLIMEMHQVDTFLSVPNIYTEFLKNNTEIPVYMQDAIPEAPASIKYPLEDITEMFLSKFKREDDIIQYFTSSICYAIALALYKGYERIELFGIDMSNNTEYIYQRDGVGLWVGIALARGVEIYLPRFSPMFDAPRYGYDDGIGKLDREEFERVAGELRPKVEKSFGVLKQAEGVVDGIVGELEAIKKKGIVLAEDDEIVIRYSDAMNASRQAIADHASLSGMLHLCRQFQMKVEKQMEAQGRAQEVIALNERWKPR